MVYFFITSGKAQALSLFFFPLILQTDYNSFDKLIDVDNQ